MLRERGQATVEYVGATIGAALIVLTILSAAGEIGGALRDGISRQIDAILDDEQSYPAERAESAPPSTTDRPPGHTAEGATESSSGELPTEPADPGANPLPAVDPYTRERVGTGTTAEPAAVWGPAIKLGEKLLRRLFGRSKPKPKQKPRPAPSWGRPAAPGNPARRVPPFDGKKARGILSASGRELPLTSGRSGPAARLPAGTRGMNRTTKTHVEGHAAAVMRQNRIKEATLYINRVPCRGRPGCDAMLPRMLPPGARLEVRGPNGFRKVYRGVPE